MKNSAHFFSSKPFKLGLLLLIFNTGIFTALGQYKATIYGNVSDIFDNLPGAKITIEGTEEFITTDIDGNYNYELEAGTYIITAEFVTYNSVSKSIIIEEDEKIELNFILEIGLSIDQPISLGSRAKPESSLKNTAAVHVISPSEISNSSETELSQILHYLLPSFHSTHQTIADGTDHIDPATLKGLGPDQILVLINGKRRHTSSLLNVNGTVGRGSVGTDFNAIPIASIERIEILRDGATSQYGSDAIAGVINIILKNQKSNILVNNSASITTEGDGFTVYSSVNFGLDIGKEGFINITAEYRDRESVNRAGNYTGTVFSDSDPELERRLLAETDFFNQTGYSGRRVMEIGSAETQNLAVSFNGELLASKNTTFYFHGGRNYREGKAKGFYRFPKDQNRVVPELFPLGFSPEILTDIQDDAIVAGFKGIKNDWNIDFSHGIGISGLGYTINNSNNASLGINSPTTFFAGGFNYKQNVTNLDISRPFDWLEGVNVAFGAELRVENYMILAGEEASFSDDGGSTFTNELGDEVLRTGGAQVFPGIRPENELDRFRTNSSGYIDVEANITEQILLRGATRYETYNDFGSQLLWNLSGRYRINEDITARLAFSNGFRAPSLHQVFFQNASSQFIGSESIEVGTFNNESAVVKALGIEELKPELSNHFSSGMSFKFNQKFTLNFDYYFISIKDRIALSGLLSEGFDDIFQPLGVGTAQFFTNAIDTKTSGINIGLEHKTYIGRGKLNTIIGFNWTDTKVNNKLKTSPSLIGREELLFGRENIARLESSQPNYKLTSSLTYELDKFKFRLGNTLFGSVKYVDPNDGDPADWELNEFNGRIESRDQVFTPKIVTDLGVSYEFTKNISLNLGGNNIFNVYPDKHKHSENTVNGNFTYSRRVQQFGVNGANYFLKLLLKL